MIRTKNREVAYDVIKDPGSPSRWNTSLRLSCIKQTIPLPLLSLPAIEFAEEHSGTSTNPELTGY